MKRQILCVLAVLLAGCASRSALIIARSAPDAAARVAQLESSSSQGLSSYARLHFRSGGKSQSVSARLFTLPRQFRAELLTPLGTEAAVLDLSEGSALWIDRLNRTYWKGSIEELTAARPGDVIGRIATLRDEAPLLFGALPSGRATPCDIEERKRCLKLGGADITVETAGISAARGSDFAIAYDPPGFPAATVTLTFPQGSLQIEHLEMRSTSTLGVIKIPSDYHCCVLPDLGDLPR